MEINPYSIHEPNERQMQLSLTDGDAASGQIKDQYHDHWLSRKLRSLNSTHPLKKCKR